MYGARPATIHDANAAIDIVDVLSEITATAEFQQAVRELNSHGTFRPRGHEHRIELVEPGDCCDRGVRRLIRGLSRRWVQFADDHEFLSRVIAGSSLFAVPTLGFLALTIAGVKQQNEAMAVLGGLATGSFGLGWLTNLAICMVNPVAREVRRYC